MPQVEREHLTPDQFLTLSAELSYRLSGRAFDPRTLLDLILENAIRAPCGEDVIERAIRVICTGYGEKRRRMGPMAVLHPLRVAAILSRLTKDPSVLDILGSLLHDRDEDLTPEHIGQEQWDRMNAEMIKVSELLDQNHQWYLGERIDYLTVKPDQEYCQYLSQLMRASLRMPDLIRIKLADRLDNTLDVGVSAHGITGHGAYGTIFDLLFLPDFKGYQVSRTYVPLSEEEGVQMLANLFKNAEFLSMLRSEGIHLEGTTANLYGALLAASTRTARNIVQDTLATAMSVEEQRKAIREVLDYCQAGGLRNVKKGTTPDEHSLDGMFVQQYGGKEGRRKRLTEIYRDKQFLVRIGVCFLASFANFTVDPGYFIQGIDPSGFHPV